MRNATGGDVVAEKYGCFGMVHMKISSLSILRSSNNTNTSSTVENGYICVICNSVFSLYHKNFILSSEKSHAARDFLF